MCVLARSIINKKNELNMFRKDRMGRRGGGVLLYIKGNIPPYEVQLSEEAD